MSKKNSYDDAGHARLALKKRYAAHDWALGYGVSADEHGDHAVSIIVANGYAKSVTDTKIEGVRVEVVERGMSKPIAIEPTVHTYEGRQLPTRFA